MKIIIAGPPHSGKSVFLDSLKDLLPADSYETVRVNKDGEGYWSNNENQNQVQAARIKESYDNDFIAERCELIKRIKKPIVLVDIGGCLFPDKQIIFESCDYFIVLAQDSDKIHFLEWKKWGEYWGAKCLALLKSHKPKDDEENDYEDVIEVNQEDMPLEGITCNLERGTDHFYSPVLQEVANRIIKISGYKETDETNSSVINFYKIAEDIGCMKVRSVGNTVVKCNPDFTSEKALELSKVLNGYPKKSSYILDGARANWVSGLGACALYKKGCNHIKLYNTETCDSVEIKKLKTTESEASDFYYEETDDSIFLHFKSARRVEIEELENILLPKLSVDKKLFISGRMPNWLFDSIAISYDNFQKYAYQPGNGCTCFDASDLSKLGDFVVKIEGIDIDAILNSQKK